jgi:hypothetical protein
MADIRGLEQAFFAASEEARRTFDILNGTGGRGGLEQRYLIALDDKEKNDAKPGSIRNFSIKEFNAIKKQYDDASAAYKRAQDAKNAARLELNRAKGTSEKEKSTKGLVDKYNQAVTKVKEAEALIPSRGQAQYDAAVLAAYDAANAAKAAGAKVAPLPKPAPGVKRPENKAVTDPTVAEGEPLVDAFENKFKGYSVNTDGTVTGPGPNGGNGNRTYFVQEKNADGSYSVSPYTSVIEARNAFLENYAEPGQIDALKQQLLARTFINKKDLETDSWLAGVDIMIAKFTRDLVTAVQYEGSKGLAFDSWFASAKGGAGSSGSTSKAGTFKDTDLNLTTIGDAYEEINDYMIDALGREATQEEKDAYFKEINQREKKSAVETVSVRDATGKITKTTRTGAKVTPEERLNARNAIVIKALGNTDAAELLKSGKGSQVAIQIGQLQKAAANYGQPMSAGEALKYVIEGGTERDALQKQTERMRLNSMTMYGNLKDHIRDGGNVKDIADQYALIKAKKLGIPVTDAFNDKDVKAALTKDGGLMSTAEFARQMQANPLWRQTEEARDVASDFANTILKSFGFMG